MKNILIDMPVNTDALKQLQRIPEISAKTIEPAEEARMLPIEQIRDVHVMFCTCPPTNVADMACLELVQIASAGYSQLFNLGLAERNVHCCNARGVFDAPIAEWNLAMMVNLIRDLRGMIQNQQAKIWDRDARFQRELRGSTVGIWGYGGIGRQTARLAKSIGMTVHVMEVQVVGPQRNVYVVPNTGDPEGTLPNRVYTPDQKMEFLSGLDFLILAMPLTKKTEGLIGEAELRALPRTAYLLNPARGPLIREPALLKALAEGWIAGAALDTHYYYPMPADHPLWSFPNVILTPHISGSSLSTHFNERVYDIFVQNVTRYLTGKPLLNQLTTDQLKGE
jgi:phosphoglycerate dehydrogenase-like enzyme